ncbi:MAG: EamA family transporter [Saccharothrix sp.]|nr:EamA family transporter [Saccharothrix sp.]
MTVEARKVKSRSLPWVALVTVWVVWGSTYLGIDAAVETIPPMLMAGTRFLLAGLIVLAFVGPRHFTGVHRPTARHLRSTAVIGALLLLGGNGLLSVGQTGLDSGTAAIIVGTVPIWMVLVDLVAVRSRITGGTVAALVLGTAGVAVLVGGPGSAIDLGAAVVVLVASVFWAVGSVYARKAPLPAHPLVSTALEMIAGGVLLLLVGVAAGEVSRLDLAAVSTKSSVGLLWLILAGAVVGFSSYIYANATLPGDIVATYAYVNPVVAVALGVLLGDEAVGPNLLVGGGLIVGAVVAVVSGHALVIAFHRRTERPPDGSSKGGVAGRRAAEDDPPGAE